MNQAQTTLFNRARHTSAQKFVLGRIIIPAMKLFFLGLFLLVLFFSIEETLAFNSSFLFASTVFFLIVLLIFCIPAYFVAMNNNYLLRESLEEYLESLENVLQLYNEYVMDTRRKVKELETDRRHFLKTIWMRCSREDLEIMQSAANERIAQIENIIGNADAKEKIRHQEYYLSLNHVLAELMKLKETIVRSTQLEFTETMYVLLCNKTQVSFDKQLHAHNMYIVGLKNGIGVLHLEIEETQKLLA